MFLDETKTVYAPIAVGELFDKITILEIKASRITDKTKLLNVTRELSILKSVADASLELDAEVEGIVDKLRLVNSQLWDVEDKIRECERNNDFGTVFIKLARSVYCHNDQRALLKKQLNKLTGSELVEEKSYAAWSS